VNLVGLIAIVATIVLTVEYRWWGGIAARGLVRLAARLLKRVHRARYLEEWLRHLEDLQRDEEHPGLLWALSNFVTGAVRVRRDAKVESAVNPLRGAIAAASSAVGDLTIAHRYGRPIPGMSVRLTKAKTVEMAELLEMLQLKDGTTVTIDGDQVTINYTYTGDATPGA
jgi:hypothetical protein